MKVERVSDTQVRFVLTKSDLDERNIKMNELAYGSDKTHQLFQEMMLLALNEYEFESENTPLMLEAMRVGADAVIVVVTKVMEGDEVEQKLNLIPEARTTAKFKRRELITPPEESSEEDSISIFSFDDFDTLANAAARLGGCFEGVSRVYKYEGRYFLMLQNETPGTQTTDDLEGVLYEYGEKHVSNSMARQFLVERAEVIIKDGAVEKLSAIMN
jgi:adapter protein MecA 1/2